MEMRGSMMTCEIAPSSLGILWVGVYHWTDHVAFISGRWGKSSTVHCFAHVLSVYFDFIYLRILHI